MEFIKETIVKGRVVSGNIKTGRFIMTGLNPSNKLVPPIVPKSFNKEWLELLISELTKVRNKLE
ncbi:hypothetical protein [Bacillus sp. AG4(2022)]|uniref:hypothetical protein n=1 Tax=Bacillus sp. AG4(2022) TaxID=2962594 RepID=UPI00288184FB|nr:hypothetical protein [Bacillus sp. AG4(2022)]MDT0160325.1 hypothetical protein [Bacillus sp. AG4(2022)]